MRAPRLVRAYDPRRSSQWPRVRREHLKREPACQACRTGDKLEVHHIHPFHLRPELELDDSNLVTLCEKPGHDCHFVFGHFHNWRRWNPNVREDAARYRAEADRAAREL